MRKRKLELQIGYIADAIIQVKKSRFNEEFTTMEEFNIIKQVIQKKIEQKNLNVKFVDAFFKGYFDVIEDVIIKVDKDTESLKMYISDTEIKELIYDEEYIYLCLCEIMINKLSNSIEHTCSNCNTYCCGGLTKEASKNCSNWSCDLFSDKYKVLKKIL